jgi:hypothetical protein
MVIKATATTTQPYKKGQRICNGFGVEGGREADMG